jgi:hypothetical protein
MGTRNLTWDNTGLAANTNITGVQVGKRLKSVGGAFAYTPLDKAITTHEATLEDNKVHEFKVQTLCTVNGPVDNTGGVKEGLTFACLLPQFFATTSTIKVVLNVSGLDLTKAKVRLFKVTGDVFVEEKIPLKTGSEITAEFTGLTDNTDHYVTIQLYAMVGGVEQSSSLCGGNVAGYQVTTELTAQLNNFDFMVLRYRNNAGGVDLDTFTGFVDNGIVRDIDYVANTNWVGYGAGSYNTDLAPYIKWAGDNTSSGGVEAILVDFKKLIEDYPALGSTIKLRLHAWWYNTRGTGAAQIELQTWLGGTVPVQSGYDFVKTDGTVIDQVTLDQNVACVRVGGAAPQVNCAQRLGELLYDKINKTAVLTAITGGCDCGGVSTECYTYVNTTGSPIIGISYTTCGGDLMTDQTINPGSGFCCQDAPSGDNAGELTLTGPC